MTKFEKALKNTKALKNVLQYKRDNPTHKLQFEGFCKVSGMFFARFWNGKEYVEVGA
jgi:hypothetical protein